jgi:prepilin-type processing-associated H-X9-DG protein
LTHPTTTIMIIEGQNCWWQHYCARHGIFLARIEVEAGTGKERLRGTLNELTYSRHGRGCNAAWLDGHVEWRTMQEFATPSQVFWDYN